VSRLSELWRVVVGQLRELRHVLRLQREIGLARRLQRQGRHGEAFRLALCTFADLSSLTAAGNPAASALLSTYAVFLDKLATQMGQPEAAREQLQQALAVCEEMLPTSPKLQATLQQYVTWYKHRLAQTGPMRTN
jgi:DNA-binding GntR family transcriptional regulator